MLRVFRALPSEDRVRALTQREILWCALNLILDDEETLDGLCPACRSRALEERCAVCGAPLGQMEGGDNASFDLEKFEAMRRGECG